MTGGGCLTSIIAAFLIVFFLVLAISTDMMSTPAQNGWDNGPTANEVQPSTVKREKLNKANVNETGYFEDDTGESITSDYDVIAGMQYFYDATGVQPYLIIADNIDGKTDPNVDEMNAYLDKRYDELFEDEQHILVLFFDNNSEWYTRLCVGTSAKVLMDNEAQEILNDYFDYYYTFDMTNDEYFATVFRKSADRIMSVTDDGSGRRTAIIIGIIVIVVIIFVIILIRSIIKSKEAAAKLEEERQKSDAQMAQQAAAGNVTMNAAPPVTPAAETAETVENPPAETAGTVSTEAPSADGTGSSTDSSSTDSTDGD